MNQHPYLIALIVILGIGVASWLAERGQEGRQLR